MKATPQRKSASTSNSAAGPFFQAKPEHATLDVEATESKQPTFFRSSKADAAGTSLIQPNRAESELETPEHQGEQEGAEQVDVQRTPESDQPTAGIGLQAKFESDRTPFFQPARVPAIQTEEREQTEEQNSETLPVQRKPIFESEEDSIPSREDRIQRHAISDVGAIALQSATPETQSASETGELEEQDREEPIAKTPQIQMMPAFSIAGTSDDGEDDNAEQPLVQFRLKIGQPRDAYEREADAMAKRVVQRLEQGDKSTAYRPQSTAEAIQTKCEVCAQEEALQRREEDGGEQVDLQPGEQMPASSAPGDEEGNSPPVVFGKGSDQVLASDADLSGQLASNKGRGDPMPAGTRGEMESAFQADFSGVRVHTGSDAVQMSQRLRAQAFTHGNDIYFNQGKYDPASREGKQLVAHELTHTLQQGASVAKKVDRKAGRTDGAGQEAPEVQTNLLDDALSLGGRVVSGVSRGARRVGGAVVSAASTVVSAGRRGLSAVGRGISNLASRGVGFFTDVIEEYVPGLTSLLSGGLVDGIKQRIIGGVRSFVGGLVQRVRSSELTAQLRETLTAVRTQVATTGAQLAGGDCSALFRVFQAIKRFAGLLLSPVLSRVRALVAQGGALAFNLWNKFGAPAAEAIQAFAGGAWRWIQQKANWIWQRTAPIRTAFGDAWSWIKTQLGIARDSASGVLDTLRQAAVNVWDSVKGQLTPFLGPLSNVATVLALISPLGPVLLVYKGAPALWNALKWVWTNLTGWQVFLDAKEIIVNRIVPVLRSGFTWLTGALGRANQWIGAQFTALSNAFNGVVTALRTSPLFRTIAGIFDSIKRQFDALMGAIRAQLSPVLTTVGMVLSNLWQCFRPVVQFLAGIIVMLPNPVAWVTFAAGLAARLAWALIPDAFKRVAIRVLLDYSIRVIRAMDRNLVRGPNIGPLWPIVVTGMISFLERVRVLGPDEVMQAIEKTLNLAIDPRTYAGLFAGGLKGFVWDGLVGLIRMVYDLIVGIPQAVYGLFQFFRNLIPDTEMVQRLVSRGRAIAEQVQAFIERPDAVQQVIEFVRRSPSILFSMVETAMQEARDWAQRTGVQVANTLFQYIREADPFNVGFQTGMVIGMLLFEVVLALGTAGTGSAVKWGGKAVQLLLKGVRAIRTALSRGGSLIRQALGMLRRVIDAGWSAAQRVGRALRGVLQSLKRYVDDVINWFLRALQRVGRTAADFARDQALWIAFKATVRTRMAPINRRYDGLTQREAAIQLRRMIRSSRIATIPARQLIVAAENRGYWELRARRRGSVNPVGEKVGEVLMDRRHRWDRGVADVRQRMRRVRDNERNERALDRILRPFERRWHFSRLDAVTDTRQNDFDIMASMSPDKKVAEVGAESPWPKGTRRDPIPVKWFKKSSDYARVGGQGITGSAELPAVGRRGRRVLNVNQSYLSMEDEVTRQRGSRPSDNKKNRIREHLRALYQLPASDDRRRTVTDGGRSLEPGDYEIDHVRDLNWYGRDIYTNLWPASDTKNNAFNANNDQYAKALVRRGGKWETETHSARHWGGLGKYFWIAYQQNVPASRGNPAGGRTPINDGNHRIPKRKPGAS